MWTNYRKEGATTRIEISQGLRSALVSTESGEASYGDEGFHSHSTKRLVSVTSSPLDEAENVVARVESLIAAPLEVERMTLLSGTARHSQSAEDHAIEWEEKVARLHLAVIKRSTASRITIDLGGGSLNSLDLGSISAIAEALVNFDGTACDDWKCLELSPYVSAELWPILTQSDEWETRETFQLYQSTHPAFTLDGEGDGPERGAD